MSRKTGARRDPWDYFNLSCIEHSAAFLILLGTRAGGWDGVWDGFGMGFKVMTSRGGVQAADPVWIPWEGACSRRRAQHTPRNAPRKSSQLPKGVFPPRGDRTQSFILRFLENPPSQNKAPGGKEAEQELRLDLRSLPTNCRVLLTKTGLEEKPNPVCLHQRLLPALENIWKHFVPLACPQPLSKGTLWWQRSPRAELSPSWMEQLNPMAPGRGQGGSCGGKRG